MISLGGSQQPFLTLWLDMAVGCP